MYKKLIALYMMVIVLSVHGKSKKSNPPHCTVVSIDNTDTETNHEPLGITFRFRLDYPAAYIIPGQREAYQQMRCLNPPAVNKAWTSVCDWAAPPQVHFTLGDDFMHVVRQDPSGRYFGNAVIITYQVCNHDMSHVILEDKSLPGVVVNDIEK